MIRETSRMAYNFIKERGLLSKRRFQVYELVYTFGPLTMNQLLEKANMMYGNKNSGVYSTRLSELRDVGCLQELGTTICPISKRKVILWDVTEKLPQKKKEKSYKDQITAIDEKTLKLSRKRRKLFNLWTKDDNRYLQF